MYPFHPFRQRKRVIVLECGAQRKMVRMVPISRHGLTELHAEMVKCVSIQNVLMHNDPAESKCILESIHDHEIDNLSLYLITGKWEPISSLQ